MRIDAFPHDSTFFIEGAIDVKHLYGLRHFLQGEIRKGWETQVCKISSGSGVDQGSGFNDLFSKE